MNNTLTAIPGIQVGHWTNLAAATGCTVILCPQGAVAGVDVRGGAPGTRETDLLNPTCMVEKVHALYLGGGSAFGLAGADGVMRWLEEQGHGFDVIVAKVPIVPGAILFDLALGDAKVRPDAAAGYVACAAASDVPVAEGNVGAGTGATVGKILGFPNAMKGGLGTACRRIGDKIIAALVAVNAAGDIVDPQTGQIVAGARHPSGQGFANASTVLSQTLQQSSQSWGRQRTEPETTTPRTNTTLGVVATNIALDMIGTTKVAQMAHDGLARAIRPVHMMTDGDIVFALSLGEESGNASLVGAVAAEVLAEAIVRA
ncbi:MAG: P1 family peptidase, partial [Caldilineaceae bacterium]|nr:P1 family peptidase [Caldilineaceae bacterium]